MFIERGADIYVRPVLPAWYGTINSLVEYASQAAHFRCVEILLDAGCDVTETVKKDIVEYSNILPEMNRDNY